MMIWIINEKALALIGRSCEGQLVLHNCAESAMATNSRCVICGAQPAKTRKISTDSFKWFRGSN
ncbi:hypothetical protein SAMN04244570_0961 [Sporosarcina newyorkensis]|uniref:Uncharacterized protein n=1 Tax=Sporosarcina newyorkensis TaxID=759851 RepID=A0A1T4XLA3_9BACL|nr:hypothetical protein SAMN04244570_0961 [Sporosarcina newyorkensis]